MNKLFEDGYQLRDSANFKYENGEVHIVQSFVLSKRGIYREIEELVCSEVIDWETSKETYSERCKSVGHKVAGEPFKTQFREYINNINREDYFPES